MKFKNITIVTLFLTMLIPAKAFSADVNPSLSISPLSIGDTLKFQSKILNEERLLNVYLPANYSQSKDKQYPVIYVLDGSMAEDFLHISGIVQFNSFSWLNFMPESIVIGIANVDRKRDFTFKSSDPLDQKEFPTSGGSDNFIKYLSSEVLPLITKQYRTNGQATLIGQSLGGLLATQVLFERPELFNNYLIVSPSLWWDKESLLSQPIKISQQKLNIYIGVGGEGSTMIKLAALLSDKVNHAYKNRGATSFKYFEELNHGDALHLAAYEGLKMIFSDHDNKNENAEKANGK